MRLRSFGALVCCLAAFVFVGCSDDSSTAVKQEQPSSVAQLNDLVVSVTEKAEVDGTEVALQTVALQDKNPFSRRIPIPGEPFAKKSGKVEWLNTDPLTLKKLRGKFVVLDFWTYCCINCHHILPVLKKLEEKYPNEIVVIGVHSAKFEEEKNTENIRDAILRHDIRHPVVNDHDHFLWNSFGVNSWPTLTVIDPEGFFVAINRGEIDFESLDGFFKNCIPYYEKTELLDKTPIEFELERYEEEPTQLKYPGKVLADQANGLRRSNMTLVLLPKIRCRNSALSLRTFTKKTCIFPGSEQVVDVPFPRRNKTSSKLLRKGRSSRLTTQKPLPERGVPRLQSPLINPILRKYNFRSMVSFVRTFPFHRRVLDSVSFH